MNCKYIWYILPTEIRVGIIQPLKNSAVENVELLKELNTIDKKLYWYNLPNIISDLYSIIKKYQFICDETVLPIKKFYWFNLANSITTLCTLSENLINCLQTPTVEYNFDMTSTDWGDIADAESFKEYLEGESGETDNVVEDFSLVDGRLRCNLSNIIEAYLYSLNIIEVKKYTVESIGNSTLALNNNNISSLNEAIFSNITYLDASTNPLTDFNITWNNPSLEALDLNFCSINSFNPNGDLSNLRVLQIRNNLMTTSSYTEMETFANSLNVISTGIRDFRFDNNTNSIVGTNLRAILIAKGRTVTP